MPEPVDPHHLLLIGAGPGVGAAVVRRFGREGFRSTLISRSQTLDRLAPELRSGGLEIEAIGADIEDLDGYRETLERMFSAQGRPGSSSTTLPCQIQARSWTPPSNGCGPPTTSMSSARSSRHR
jgi:NAD(P)-dependent dehydrogenase (short-subunit alcohol dehydrogenase family)